MLKNQKGPKTGALAPAKHGLFRDSSKVNIDGLDGRKRKPKRFKAKIREFLSGFGEPIPPRVKSIARQAAFKDLNLEDFENFILAGGCPPETTVLAYTATSNSFRQDMAELDRKQKRARPTQERGMGGIYGWAWRGTE